MGVLSKPELLTSKHLLDDFDCGEVALNRWLKQHALQAAAANSARTYVVCDGLRVVGFYALATASILHGELPLKQREGLARHPVPALLIARLGVDLNYQRQGIAGAMVKNALAKALTMQQITGLVALIVHAKSEQAQSFYEALGFEASPATAKLMALYLKI